jgi:hypothetical protein
MEARRKHLIDLDLSEEAAILNIAAGTAEAMNKNTKKQYDSKQLEFLVRLVS